MEENLKGIAARKREKFPSREKHQGDIFSLQIQWHFMGQPCENIQCQLFLTAIAIGRLSLLKCKFIIGVSWIGTLLTACLIVSEQRINTHLVDALLKSFLA